MAVMVASGLETRGRGEGLGQDETAAAAGSWSKALGIDEQRF